MNEQPDYIVVFALKSVTFTSRVVKAPNVSVAIARAVMGMAPGDEVLIRSGVITNVRAYKRVAVSEEVDYAF